MSSLSQILSTWFTPPVVVPVGLILILLAYVLYINVAAPVAPMPL